MRSSPISTAHAAQLHEAVASIAEAIARTRTELASLRDGQDAARLVDELTAVVNGTAEATHTILSAETIQDLTVTLERAPSPETARAAAASLQNETRAIFEACNFQDLAGQRIAKVLRTLGFIEARVALIHGIWGGEEGPACHARTPDAGSEAALLNGPALPGGAVSQTDIDSYFP